MPGIPDINHEIVPEDNRYLVVHESSGFGSGDDQKLQTILDFITRKTKRHDPPAEKLHAVW